MYVALFAMAEAVIIASALSIDAFTAGFAYGSNKINVPFLSIQIINLICSFVTGLSLFAGVVLKPYLPPWVSISIAFVVLFLIGVVKLLDGIAKSIIMKYRNFNKDFKFSLFNIKFILNLYADPEAADVDASKIISPAEAAALAVSLSLDGIAVGFGAALANSNGLLVFLCSFVTNAVAITAGHYLGCKVAKKLPFNIAWLSGILLIGLAFSKFI